MKNKKQLGTFTEPGVRIPTYLLRGHNLTHNRSHLFHWVHWTLAIGREIGNQWNVKRLYTIPSTHRPLVEHLKIAKKILLLSSLQVHKDKSLKIWETWYKTLMKIVCYFGICCFPFFIIINKYLWEFFKQICNFTFKNKFFVFFVRLLSFLHELDHDFLN